MRGTVSTLWASTSGRLSKTSASRSGLPLKSGIRFSTPVSGLSAWIARTVSAYSQAPPSGRSSRATPVMVAYFRPIVDTLSATRRGSSRSSGWGLPVSIWQKSQRRVDWSPPIRNVASRSSQHSKMFGQPASWQTVCSCSDFTSFCSAWYSGPIFARVLIHSGLRSIGVSALRTSSLSSFRPSGAMVTPSRVRVPAQGCFTRTLMSYVHRRTAYGARRTGDSAGHRDHRARLDATRADRPAAAVRRSAGSRDGAGRGARDRAGPRRLADPRGPRDRRAVRAERGDRAAAVLPPPVADPGAAGCRGAVRGERRTRTVRVRRQPGHPGDHVHGDLRGGRLVARPAADEGFGRGRLSGDVRLARDQLRPRAAQQRDRGTEPRTVLAVRLECDSGGRPERSLLLRGVLLGPDRVGDRAATLRAGAAGNRTGNPAGGERQARGDRRATADL